MRVALRDPSQQQPLRVEATLRGPPPHQVEEDFFEVGLTRRNAGDAELSRAKGVKDAADAVTVLRILEHQAMWCGEMRLEGAEHFWERGQRRGDIDEQLLILDPTQQTA